MIQETIVTSLSTDGQCHIAPMGVHVENDFLIILPFRPSLTLENITHSGCAVLSHSDDVRVFAGCLTGRRSWPLVAAERIAGMRLRDALSHQELELVRMEDNAVRPRLICRVVHTATHASFTGFNRAQFSVLELAILVSRLDRLPKEKLESDLAYLRIGFEKTAGEREREAWEWLMEPIDSRRRKTEGDGL
ncbi:DUF447 family protein [Candidatus Methylospira mobilis]|uniref:DUF447 family protein n=1 Tax=Candidatus Methylospira mobilis TaxID=1808979 RepID=A0A5Q0BK20_9GAMM|nr:DUF447 domain-containing protein [Candidatus Methylospira mobilis]QFY44235.1 DUF447 family protein [Candidatus Methylospira mobilis]WNV06338.1 DUF447 family protein [Candidatus Methylospira mobilis]